MYFQICESKVVSMLALQMSYMSQGLASMAQLDARQTGDQEVAGSTPAWTNILSWRFDHEIFSTVILSIFSEPACFCLSFGVRHRPERNKKRHMKDKLF